MIIIRDGRILAFLPTPRMCEKCKRASMILVVAPEGTTCVPCNPRPKE